MQPSGDHISAARNTIALPSALEHADDIRKRVQRKRVAVFLDYDGTLTPIVARPELAFLSAHVRQTLMELASCCPVIIISGRDRTDVQHLVQLDNIFYAGNHGFDIVGPHGQQMTCERGDAFLPILARVEQELLQGLAPVEGAFVERKKFSIAVHVRGVAREDEGKVETIVDHVLVRYPNLRKSYGKKVFELQPRLDWHKGKAVLWFLQALQLDEAEVLPLYIGDDLTDEDAFRTIADGGLGIVVETGTRPTAANYALKHPEEVHSFLRHLISWLHR